MNGAARQKKRFEKEEDDQVLAVLFLVFFGSSESEVTWFDLRMVF